jgi:hypothetical protein
MVIPCPLAEEPILSKERPNEFSRRKFLQITGCAAAAELLDGCGPVQTGSGSSAIIPSVAIIHDPADFVAAAASSQWALNFLRQSLESRGVAVKLLQHPDQASAGDFCIVAAGGKTALARQAAVPDGAESLALSSIRSGERNILLAAANDERGLVYALTELADRVNYSDDPIQSLRVPSPILERPANRIRGVTRLFVSDVEDKAWFNDRDFWQGYLTMLATHRFNRFHLGLGLGYDFPRQLRDTYFYFPYPFLLSVPGYSVRATGLPDAERDHNLQMLRFISDQAAMRGLRFQLGLWTHAFQWTDSPDVNHVIEGLTPDKQAAYCRDALHLLLEASPSIGGITLRTHGESGVAEGNYDFWKTLYDGILRTGRPIEIDIHAKGIDQRMIDTALATGLPVTVSPKFWAEHMGLPYLPASIRKSEMPRERPEGGFFALSTGSRNFMRYSYGDLFQQDRRYAILHRIWPGTQRLLLWGDPAFAAEYGRTFSFCGSDGVDWMEPLTFKGRKGSGLPGGRDGYASPTMRAGAGDYEKYLYSYRLWGRLAYNPDSDPDIWRRQLRHEYGDVAASLESALAQSSRVLPMITTAHDPSAANARYWPEMYTNMSICDDSKQTLYTDTPKPKIFSNVSSLDPQIFASIDEFAESLLHGKPIAKISPMEVAGQLEDWSMGCITDLAPAEQKFSDSDPAYRRLTTDAAIAACIGRFFAFKIRAAVLWSLFDHTAQESARGQAIYFYQSARAAWGDLCAFADEVYVRDITFGDEPQIRGHWQDRLAAMDEDIALMRRTLPTARNAEPPKAVIDFLVTPLPTPRPTIDVQHLPPMSFVPGEPIDVVLNIESGTFDAATLWYRHVNQAEAFQSMSMQRDRQEYRASVPGEYTNSSYPLQYYFELGGTIYPGFRADFLGQPYFIVRQV